MVLERRPEAASENTQLSLETPGGGKVFLKQELQGAPGTPWVPSKAKALAPAIPGTAAFSGQMDHAV